MITTSTILKIHPEVNNGLRMNQPVVALESAVITHGLPFPDNLNLAQEMEKIISDEQVIPATIGIIDGQLCIGLTTEELNNLATHSETHKISRRDYAPAFQKKWSGGTTVAGTLIAMEKTGIQVFATGGIGGVHHGNVFDISADLLELSRTPAVVVCAGAKSILDLPATLEVLETNGIPVIGYQTDELPAFYARSSGLRVSAIADSPDEIAQMYLLQKILGLKNAVLVVNPVPEEYALPYETMDKFIKEGIRLAKEENIHGSATTPFLLDQIARLSQGKSLSANLALLKNNAYLAAKIATQISRQSQKKSIKV